MHSKYRNIQAIVTRMYSAKGADRVLHLLTEKGEKLVVIAKGSKRISSRKAHALDVGNEISIKLAFGKGLPIITEAKLINNNPGIKSSYVGLITTQFVCELCSIIAQEESPEPGLFNNLQNLLQTQSYQRPSLLISGIIIRVLSVIGNLPPIDKDILTAEKINIDKPFWKSPLVGYTQMEQRKVGDVVSPRLIKVQKFMMSYDFNHIGKLDLEIKEQQQLLHTLLGWLEMSDVPLPKSTDILLSSLW